MEGRLLLDVVVGKSSAILQLLASEDQPLLIWGNTLLVLDLGLDVLNAIGGLDLEGDGLPSEGLDEDLHASPQPENEMEGRLLLDVVVRESPAILQLLASEDQPLLIRGDTFLVLDLSLDVLNAVRGLDLGGDGLPSQSLDEDLHTSPQPKNEVKGRLLLDVVVGKSSSVLQLLAGEDQPLLIWGNAFLVLDLGLDVLNAIGGLDLEGDGLPSQSLDENLHASPQPENEVKGRLLLDVVVGKSPAILQLLASEDQPLLIWWNAFLILNLGLHILNGIRWLNLEGDGFPGKGLDEDLHDATFFVSKFLSRRCMTTCVLYVTPH